MTRWAWLLLLTARASGELKATPTLVAEPAPTVLERDGAAVPAEGIPMGNLHYHAARVAGRLVLFANYPVNADDGARHCTELGGRFPFPHEAEDAEFIGAVSELTESFVRGAPRRVWIDAEQVEDRVAFVFRSQPSRATPPIPWGIDQPNLDNTPPRCVRMGSLVRAELVGCADVAVGACVFDE
jgi:hypothetical protein